MSYLQTSSVSPLAQAMQRQVVTVQASDELLDAVRVMHQAQTGCVFVLEQQRLVGLVSEPDIVQALAQGIQIETASLVDVMQPDPPTLTIAQVEDLASAVQTLQPGPVQYIPVVDEQHHVVGAVTWQDLQDAMVQSDRLRVETALQQTADRYRGIVEHAIDGIFQTDVDGRYLSANPSLARMYGYESADELIASQPNFKRQLYVDDRRRAEFIALMSQHGALSNFESQVYRRDGSVIWISETCRAVRDAHDNLLYYEGIVKDISDRKAAEQALQQKNEELLDTLQQLRATQAELIQSEKMAALGQLVAGIAHEINTPLGAIRSSIENISEFLQDTLQRLPDFFRSLSPPQYQDFFALLERSRQRTNTYSSKERRQFKRQLIRQLESVNIANADTVADTLVDIGIHDDIQPLMALLTDASSDAILTTAYQLSSLSKSTETIIMATDRAAKMVFALRTYARHDASSEKQEANIIDGLETILTLYYNQLKHGVEVVRDYTDVPSIVCYQDELNQVWTNLIHNALQAMDYKGTLKIGVHQQDNTLVVQIEDSGKGISPEVLPKIFDPFFTTKPAGEGSGLGLDIVRKIIDKHEGRITVQSIPGSTLFTVAIPVHR